MHNNYDFLLQICISFLLHCGLVVIPKSVTEKRIIENLNSTKVSLDDSEIKQLMDIDKNVRLLGDIKMYLPKGATLEDAFDFEKDAKFVIENK